MIRDYRKRRTVTRECSARESVSHRLVHREITRRVEGWVCGVVNPVEGRVPRLANEKNWWKKRSSDGKIRKRREEDRCERRGEGGRREGGGRKVEKEEMGKKTRKKKRNPWNLLTTIVQILATFDRYDSISFPECSFIFFFFSFLFATSRKLAEEKQGRGSVVANDKCLILLIIMRHDDWCFWDVWCGSIR